MRNGKPSDLDRILASLEAPVLIISTHVGRGMFYLGEALREHFPHPGQVEHIPIEAVLPPRAVREDLKRYKFIANRLTPLLYLIYKCPLFYYRKYLREKRLRAADLSALEERITGAGIRTVVCISHRAAFWTSSLKFRRRLGFRLWDLLGEFGHNHGYRYLFWDVMDGFLSPLDPEELRIPFPVHVRFEKIALPARRAFVDLAARPGDRRRVLLVCGYWGQGPILKVLRRLLAVVPDLTIHTVCGENRLQYEKVAAYARTRPGVEAHGTVESLAPLMAECGTVITKPGISTLVEAHAAGRRIFLLKGMPVAEDNNARYAREHFGAEWYRPERLKEWCEG